MRIKLISKLINVNENLIFYPRLRKFYLEFLKTSQPLIIDVGCNHGQSIEFFLKINHRSKIIGFEPNKSIFTKLEKKYSSNNDVTIHHKGISNIDGELLFKENVLDLTSTFESINIDSSYLKMKARVLGVEPENVISAEYSVPVMKLSTFFEENKITQIDVLKIDVEGHELQCFHGLFYPNVKIPYIQFIQFESHKDDMYSDQNEKQIIDLLTQNNFKEVKTIKHGFGNFFEVIYENQSK